MISRNLQHFMVKQSRPMGLDDVPQGQGSDQIANALNLLEQARVLARPADAALQKNRITRSEMMEIVEELASDTGEKYDLASRKANPKQRALIGGIAGGLGVPLLGMLTGIGSPMALMGAGLLTGGLGAGYGYHSGQSRNRQLLGTANVLKDYGLLKPKLLRRALPLLKQSTTKRAYGVYDEHSIDERFDPLYYDYASHDPSYVEKGVPTATKFKNLRNSIQQFSSNVSGIHPDLRLRFSPMGYGDGPQYTAEELLKILKKLEQRSKGKGWDWEDTESYEDDFPYFYNVENNRSGGWFSKKPTITDLPDKVMIALQAAFKGETPDYSILDNIEEDNDEPSPWNWKNNMLLQNLAEDIAAARKDPDSWSETNVISSAAANAWYDSDRGIEASDTYLDHILREMEKDVKSSSLSNNLQQSAGGMPM